MSDDGRANLDAATIRRRLADNPPLMHLARQRFLSTFQAWRERVQELILGGMPVDLAERHNHTMALAQALNAAIEVLEEAMKLDIIDGMTFHRHRDSLWQLHGLEVPVRTFDPPAPPGDVVARTVNPAEENTYDSAPNPARNPAPPDWWSISPDTDDVIVEPEEAVDDPDTEVDRPIPSLVDTAELVTEMREPVHKPDPAVDTGPESLWKTAVRPEPGVDDTQPAPPPRACTPRRRR